MSSILKALKKLENDKAIRRPDQLRIDAKILHDGAPTKYSRSAATLIAIALFAGGGGATYFYMKPAISILNAPQAQQQPGGDSVRRPPINVHIQSVSKKAVPGPSALPVQPPKQQSVSGITATPPPHATTVPRPSQPEKEVEGLHLPSSRTVNIPAASTGAVTRPALTINGIAFQDGGSDNLAVINGITVINGAVIDGVKIEEIQKDRVRFSQDGEKFEIILNKSNR